MKDKGIFQRVFRYDMRVGVWQVRYRYGIAGIFLIIFISKQGNYYVLCTHDHCTGSCRFDC